MLRVFHGCSWWDGLDKLISGTMGATPRLSIGFVKTVPEGRRSSQLGGIDYVTQTDSPKTWAEISQARTRQEPVDQFLKLWTSGNVSFSLLSADDEKFGIDGVLGEYRVTAILGVPGKDPVAGTSDLATLMESGDSSLILPSNVQMVSALDSKYEHVTVALIPNSRHHLARLRLTFEAQNRDAAERYAYDLVEPLLSYFSHRYDVGIESIAYEVLESKSGILSYSLNLLGEDKLFDADFGAFSEPEFRAVLAAYREGMNSFNPLYQSLCFYKVVDACHQLRKSKRSQAVNNGEAVIQVSESIPLDLENSSRVNFNDASRFEPYLGKKFTWVQNHFRHTIRNAFAHLDPTESGDSYASGDRHSDVVMCRMAVPVLRYMARILIEAELNSNLTSKQS
jgi:hypothetical protein